MFIYGLPVEFVEFGVNGRFSILCNIDLIISISSSVSTSAKKMNMYINAITKYDIILYIDYTFFIYLERFDLFECY